MPHLKGEEHPYPTANNSDSPYGVNTFLRKESRTREYTSTDIEKITYSDGFRRNIEYAVGEVAIYLSLENTNGIERYYLRIEANFSVLNDGKTNLPVDMINDINDIISGHSYNKPDLTSLVSKAYEKNSYEEEKKMFHYIAYNRDFVDFFDNWVIMYSAKRIYSVEQSLYQYEEEFYLGGLTKQGSK